MNTNSMSDTEVRIALNLLFEKRRDAFEEWAEGRDDINVEIH